VLSAAITDGYYETRKQQYADMFKTLTQFGYKNPYVIEALKKRGPTYFEQWTQNVFYATENNPKLKNVGINEALTMLEGLKYFNFDPEDMVIKLTGRYECTSDKFLKFVESHQDVDAIVKFTPDGKVLTLAYAMKFKHFIHMFEHLDYDAMEKGPIYLEQAVGKYIIDRVKAGNFNVITLEKVYVKANLQQSSTGASAVWGSGNNNEVLEV
jgi:hypothetical protein